MPIGAVLFSYMLLRSTVYTLKQGGIIWRGTFYPLEELKRGAVCEGSGSYSAARVYALMARCGWSRRRGRFNGNQTGKIFLLQAADAVT